MGGAGGSLLLVLSDTGLGEGTQKALVATRTRGSPRRWGLGKRKAAPKSEGHVAKNFANLLLNLGGDLRGLFDVEEEAESQRPSANPQRPRGAADKGDRDQQANSSKPEEKRPRSCLESPSGHGADTHGDT